MRTTLFVMHGFDMQALRALGGPEVGENAEHVLENVAHMLESGVQMLENVVHVGHVPTRSGIRRPGYDILVLKQHCWD